MDTGVLNIIDEALSSGMKEYWIFRFEETSDGELKHTIECKTFKEAEDPEDFKATLQATLHKYKDTPDRAVSIVLNVSPYLMLTTLHCTTMKKHNSGKAACLMYDFIGSLNALNDSITDKIN